MEYVSAMSGFDGRLHRKPYWIASLILLLIIIVAFALITYVTVTTMNPSLAYWLGALVQLAIIYPASAVMAKRLHDRNKSGKWALLLVVPALVYTFTNVIGWTERLLSDWSFVLKGIAFGNGLLVAVGEDTSLSLNTGLILTHDTVPKAPEVLRAPENRVQSKPCSSAAST